LETSPGSSGSPVFDEKGALVGIVKGRFRGTNTIGFLIPISRIKAFIDEP
jgi:serine protease Do